VCQKRLGGGKGVGAVWKEKNNDESVSHSVKGKEEKGWRVVNFTRGGKGLIAIEKKEGGG